MIRNNITFKVPQNDVKANDDNDNDIKEYENDKINSRRKLT